MSTKPNQTPDEHEEDLLDEALEESFPASDVPSIPEPHQPVPPESQRPQKH